MTLEEYSEAIAQTRDLPSGERHPAWRRIRSARQRYLTEQRRLTDPAWWESYLARNAEYRRRRAENDDDYRHLRNAQAK